jgi:two-component system, chemotaxis family, protein-glutamate methylesterase/glutaminase
MGQTTSYNSERFGVVAVGASAGGVEALTHLAAGLPEEFPYAIAIVLHMPAAAPSVLARIIDRSGPLPAVRAEHHTPLEPGHIYVCVPDRHLLVDDHRVVLSDGPTENGYRPAINALFRSVALSYGPLAIGVLLSGVLDDGVLGLGAIRSCGGTTVVQNPHDALYPAMPKNALQAGVAEHEANTAEMGRLLTKLSEREIEVFEMTRNVRMELENRIAMGRRFFPSIDTEVLGPPSGYVCPDCNGSLQAISEGNYRCQVGHAWTSEALLRARDEEVEGALWVALRSLQEKAKLARRLAENEGGGLLFERYNALAREAEHAVTVLGDRLSEAYADAGERDAG